LEKESEKEFEKQFSGGKAKIGLVVCAVLVATLAISGFWFFSRVNTLETEKSRLQSQVNGLQLTIESLVSAHMDATFSYYYIKPKEQKFGVYNLEDELTGLEWIRPYEEGLFDCSEMSAYLEWYLENEGWHAIIVAGDSPFGSGYHAWLSVETEQGGYLPVETTTMEIVWWDDPYFDNYFKYDYQFEDILDALDYYETEFDWWK